MAFKVQSSKLILRLCKPIVFTSCRGPKRYLAPTLYELGKRQKQENEEAPREIRRGDYSNWNHSAEVYAFGKRLGEEFKIELLLQAFINKSFIVHAELRERDAGIENPDLSGMDNELLAAKGEPVLSDFTYKYLALNFPKLPLEGITGMCDFLLKDETLAEISMALGVKDIIFTAEYPVETATYVKTLKAIIGALLESSGIERANLFVRDFVITKLVGKDPFYFIPIESSFKVLSDILERDGREKPEPRLISGSAVNTIFANYQIGLYSNKELIGTCNGESVDVAIEMAATDALKRMFDITDTSKPLRFNITCTLDEPSNLRLSEWSETNLEKTFNKAAVTN